MLRDSAGEASRDPQPSVDRLDALLEHVRGAGLWWSSRSRASRGRLPSGVDRSAYRIVQEALTNTLKHAGPAHASVPLRYAPRRSSSRCSTTGRAPASVDGGGFGLVGMRERAALYGGALDAGPRPGGGYALRARLPLERVRP